MIRVVATAVAALAALLVAVTIATRPRVTSTSQIAPRQTDPWPGIGPRRAYRGI